METCLVEVGNQALVSGNPVSWFQKPRLWAGAAAHEQLLAAVAHEQQLQAAAAAACGGDVLVVEKDSPQGPLGMVCV